MSLRTWARAAHARILAAMGCIAAVAFAAPLAAQSVESFYKGTQVKLIIGSTPGGDYDLWSRIIGRHMTRHLPGQPAIVPQNMPGGGTIVAANHLYNLAAKDGSVFGVFSRNLPGQAVLNMPNIKFDPQKFGYLGSPELPSRICLAVSTSAVKSAADLFTRELLVGGSGAGTAPSFMPSVLNKVVGMKFKVIEGYGGTNEIVLAMERGEVEGICQGYAAFSTTKPDWVKSGKVRILFNLERTPFPFLPGVPSIFDYVKNEEDRQILSFITIGSEIGRPYVTPPGVPAERFKALQDAFAQALRDPDLLSETKKQGLDVTYRSGAELHDLITRMYATPKPVLDKAAAVMPAGGGG